MYDELCKERGQTAEVAAGLHAPPPGAANVTFKDELHVELGSAGRGGRRERPRHSNTDPKLLLLLSITLPTKNAEWVDESE